MEPASTVLSGRTNNCFYGPMASLAWSVKSINVDDRVAYVRKTVSVHNPDLIGYVKPWWDL